MDHEEKVLKILSLCMKAKKMGHDVFFRYNPHVNEIDIDVHIDGWAHGGGTDDDFSVYLYKDYTDAGLNDIIEYLENLI